MILEFHGFGALCFKIKSLARQSFFASSWTFWKACNKTYNFHVLSFFWIQMDLGEKWPRKWEKTMFLNTWKFFLCVRKNSNLDFLLTFSHFLIFYDHWWIIWNIFMIEKVWFWKSWPKVKVWLFWADEFSSDGSEFV